MNIILFKFVYLVTKEDLGKVLKYMNYVLRKGVLIMKV